MGGVDDSGRSRKRVKVVEFPNLVNNLCLTESSGGSVGNFMARPLHYQGDEAMVGSQGVINKVEFVRIIGKALHSLGYEKTGKLLEEESGIPLHSFLIEQFTRQIIDEQWDESIATLRKIDLVDEKTMKNASFLILEYKFFELLSKRKEADALTTLRAEIVPLNINKERVHELSGYLIAPHQYRVLTSINGVSFIKTANSKLLDELQQMLPSTLMIPEQRLEQLVEQALSVQRKTCIFHNSLDKSISLYSDHQCGRDELPSHALQVLQEHEQEVWLLQFSNNGRYLASSSSDQAAIIWEVNKNGTVTRKQTLRSLLKPISSLAWSPDDRQILTCVSEGAVCRWDASSGERLCTYQKPGIGSVTSGWLPDGSGVLAGLCDKSICIWNLEGEEVKCWKGQRIMKISDLAVTSDGKQIISMCRENAIMLLEREAKMERLIEENETITSFSLSKDNKFLLVSLMNQEIHMWSIVDDLNIVARYKGHKRSRFVVRSCFGGLEQAFVASGSEDSLVYIWHRDTGELVGVLTGHSGTVNAVSWNPMNPRMLASASDDRTIRIWGLKEQNFKRREYSHSNGVANHCNGYSK